jgi:hypothetical protein
VEPAAHHHPQAGPGSHLRSISNNPSDCRNLGGFTNPSNQRRKANAKITRNLTLGPTSAAIPSASLMKPLAAPPLVQTSRTASSSNSFVNRLWCVIEFLIPHTELSTFPK